MDKQQLQSYINRLQADCDSLIGKYGQGVRPSWVSCDLALNYDEMERAQAELDLLMHRGSLSKGTRPTT